MRSHLNQKCHEVKKDEKQPTLDFSRSMVSFGLLPENFLSKSHSNNNDSDDSYDPGDAMDSDATNDWNISINDAYRCANVLFQATAPQNLTAKKYSISK